MLRRERQLRNQLARLLDASLFALSFWMSHVLRQDNVTLARLGGPIHIQAFSEYAWLLLVIGPVAPLILEMHGFYSRPLIESRGRTGWQLIQGCALSMLVVIVLMFLFNQKLSRAVIILFGPLSFTLVMLKEEIVRRWTERNVAQGQYRKRLILLG